MIQTLWRKKACFLILFFLPLFVHAQNISRAFGNFSFSLTPRILPDGSIIDLSLGMVYSDSLGGEVQFRYTQIAGNEEITGADDSLNAIKETIFEIFVLPVQYRLVQKQNSRLMVGAGLYYEYDKLEEKGFFTLNFLEDLGFERVNSYKNDFIMHLAGPLLDGRVYYNSEWFDIGFTAGIVPIFYINFVQKLSMEPLLSPGTASLSENTWGSPYFYLSLDSTILGLVNTTFTYNYARLAKKVVDFDDNLDWVYPEQSVVTQSIRIEVSVLLGSKLFGGKKMSDAQPGSEISFQVGYGYMHNFISMDSSPVIQEGKHYLILSTKKLLF